MESNDLREFPELSSAAFQHPFDVQATANLQKVPLLPPLLKVISGEVFEKQMRLMSIANTVRLGPNQGRSVYEKFVKAAKILDLQDDLPEIYVNNQYVVNAYAFGLKKYQITLYSGLIDALTEDELLAVIGHELGHVKCEHMLYKTMVYILRVFGLKFLISLVPAIGNLAAIPLQLAILQWERMAELSCDRAALLVVQDREIVASALSKLAGGSQKILSEINLDDVLEQAQEYEETDHGVIEQLFKVSLLLQQTHPFPIIRAKEIMKWGESEQYQTIMHGDYVRKDQEATVEPPGPAGKVCPNCTQVSDVSASTCLACGTSLEGARQVCTNCGVKVFSSWQTCPGCGNELKGTDEAEDEA